jgi:hypothetical protein
LNQSQRHQWQPLRLARTSAAAVSKIAFFIILLLYVATRLGAAADQSQATLPRAS